MRRRSLLFILACLALGAAPADAAELGACGDGRDIETVIASSATGAAVGEGMARGVVVYLRGLSKADGGTIDMPYGGLLIAEPKGERFALIQDKTIYVYSFSGFRRLSKSSAKVLKDQSLQAWRWIDGTDDLALFGSIVKTDFMGEEKSRQTHLLRVNVVSGEGTLLPLEPPKGFLSAAFDEKGERIAIGFGDGHVEIRSAADGKLLASYRGHDAPWNSLGLAFHPTKNLVASSDGSRLIFFDLERQQIQSVHKTQDGARLLEFVADAQYLIGGDSSSLSLLDLEGRRLETRHSDAGYESFYVADRLRKVFSAGGDRVCWRTFERWEVGRAPAAPKDTASSTAAELQFKGKPLSHYIRQLNDKDFTTRLFAFAAIEQIGPAAEAAVPALIEVLDGKEPARKSNEPSLQSSAIAALGAIGPAAAPAAGRIGEALKSEDADLRRVAARALLRLGPAAKDAVPALITDIPDPVLDIRELVIRALGEIGPDARAAIPALKAVEKDKKQEQYIRNSTDEALEKIEKRQ